jgi:phosphoglycolate phosphatase/putative hydrolase of the HAD superfamily
MSGAIGSREARAQAIDWGPVGLVVFDLDGTLYDARRLRLRMAAWLLADAARHRSLQVPRTLATFRRMRESLAEAGARASAETSGLPAQMTRIDARPGEAPMTCPGVDFLRLQYRLPAQRLGCRPAEVQARVEDWMERRPLRWLAACRRPGIAALFDALRAQGKQVAVLSDYPALDKLAALGLRADPVVWAGDAGVGRLKPDPRGLRQILARTGVAADRTVVVGDRADRDGAVAARVGARALLLGRPRAGRASAPDDALWIQGFNDPLFAPLLQAGSAGRPGGAFRVNGAGGAGGASGGGGPRRGAG